MHVWGGVWIVSCPLSITVTRSLPFLSCLSFLPCLLSSLHSLVSLLLSLSSLLSLLSLPSSPSSLPSFPPSSLLSLPSPPSLLPYFPSLQAVSAVLDNPNEPVNDLSYFDCLDLVIDKSKVLGEAGAHITMHAKKGDHEEFGKAVENTSLAVCQLTEAASQAAYLVGIADPSSTAATPGLVDQTQFARASQAISMACQNLLNPSSTQQQVRRGGKEGREGDQGEGEGGGGRRRKEGTREEEEGGEEGR